MIPHGLRVRLLTEGLEDYKSVSPSYKPPCRHSEQDSSSSICSITAELIKATQLLKANLYPESQDEGSESETEGSESETEGSESEDEQAQASAGCAFRSGVWFR